MTLRKFLSLLTIGLLLSTNPAFAATTNIGTTANLSDGSGNAITSTGNALDVNIKTPATLPVSAASLPLPSGAATSALQTTGNSSLSSIDGKTPSLVSGRMPVDPSGVTSPISAASLPLPTGAATAAKQPAIGTAGSPSADVITVQGSASGTAIPVSFSSTVATNSTTFTSVTTGTTIDTHLNPVKYFTIQAKATGAVTSWSINLECSLNNVDFTPVLTHTNVTPGTGLSISNGTSAYACLYIRANCTAITLGGGTNVIAVILGT